MCQGLLPSRRHFEKREDPGEEVGVAGWEHEMRGPGNKDMNIHPPRLFLFHEVSTFNFTCKIH